MRVIDALSQDYLLRIREFTTKSVIVTGSHPAGKVINPFSSEPKIRLRRSCQLKHHLRDSSRLTMSR